MNALQVMERYRKEVVQVSTQNNDIKVQYLYDTCVKKGYPSPPPLCVVSLKDVPLLAGDLRLFQFSIF